MKSLKLATLHERLEYSIKDTKLKRSTRHDKRAHVDDIVMKAETTVERGRTEYSK